MTRLYALRDGLFQELDAKDSSIELNFQIEDLRSPAARQGPFSLTFELPFTDTNNAFFGHVAEPSLKESQFDINRRVEARLHDDNVIVMEGIIQVTSMDLTKRVYKTRFYSATVDIFTFLRGKKWEDVWRRVDGNVFCPLDHTISTSNVIRCWQGNNPSDIDSDVPAGTVDYPLTDNGNNTRYNTFPTPLTVNQAMVAPGNFSAMNLHPAVKCSYLIDQMLAYAGYTRTTDFWDDTSVHNQFLYVIIGLQQQQVNLRAEYGFRISTSGIAFTASGTTLTTFITTWDDSTAPNYDPDNIIQGGVYFKPNLPGQYVMQVTIQQTLPLSGQWNSTFELFGLEGFNTTYQFAAGQAASSSNGITFTMQPIVEPGDVNGYFGWAISTQATASFDVTVTYVNFYAYNQQFGKVDMVGALGDEPLEKWLKGWMETFNLVMDVNEQTKEVTFVPYDDYISEAGDPADWTDKVDFTGPMELLPPTEYQKSRLYLRKAESPDHRNAYYRNQFGLNKGDYTYVARSDFAEGEHVIGDFFGYMRLSQVPYRRNINTGIPLENSYGTLSEIIISELWSGYTRDDPEYDSVPPLLCYRHGYQNITLPQVLSGEDLYLDDTVVTGFLPLHTSSTEVAAGSGTFISLEYAASAPDLVDTSVIGTPAQGLLEAYWFNYVQRLYSKDTRVLKCRARLTPLDIQGFDFARSVNIENVQYRGISLNNYIVGQEGLTNVTLLKESDGAVYDCELTAEIGADGRIRWFDANGNPADPTALCCAAYGWTWNSERETCSAFVRRDSQGDTPRRTGTAGSPTYAHGIVAESEREVFQDVLSGTVTREQFDMSVTTVDASSTKASTVFMGDQTFEVADDKSVNVIVDWVAVQTSGSNIGESSSGQDSFLLNTVNKSTTKSSGAVYSRGTSGLSVDLVASDGTAGSKFEVRCTGLSTTNIEWFIHVTLTSYDASRLVATTPVFYQFQDLDVYEFQDGDQYLFNA